MKVLVLGGTRFFGILLEIKLKELDWIGMMN